MLAVEDTGIGLDDVQRVRLFQPFSQADSSTTRRYGGTGLGLSIVRRLAQLMGGDVALETRPSVGSTFTVSLVVFAAPATSPLVSLLRADAKTTAPVPLSQNSGRAKLLVVVDHPVNREVLVRQLALLGLTADTAEDGRTALVACAAETIRPSSPTCTCQVWMATNWYEDCAARKQREETSAPDYRSDRRCDAR